jgi:peptidoglycan/LPS O-acetylase OafA/YrhL
LIALTLIQVIAVATAGLALLVGIWMLVIAKRPWCLPDDESPTPRVRLLGLSYILVFGATVQVVVQPRGDSALALGALMVMGGLIVIAVVALEARARRRADLSDTAVERLRKIRSRDRSA